MTCFRLLPAQRRNGLIRFAGGALASDLRIIWSVVDEIRFVSIGGTSDQIVPESGRWRAVPQNGLSADEDAGGRSCFFLCLA